MEMPIDIINKHTAEQVTTVRKLTANQLAMNIDLELQRKFVFIPYEEIEAVEIEVQNISPYPLRAGSGPETIKAGYGDNPAWLYNSAVHALAMWQHLSRLQEKQAEEEKLAKRPEPGVYQGTRHGTSYFTAVVTEDRRVLIAQQGGSGGLDDCTSAWDKEPGCWQLQRIDTATGTIEASA